MGWEHWMAVLEAFAMAAIGIVVKDIKEDIHVLNEDFKRVNQDFQRKDDIDKTLNRIFAVLDRIETKLDGKADKRA